MTRNFGLTLLLLMAGAVFSEALPSALPNTLRSRRALRDEAVASGFDVQTLLFSNTCDDTGVHFGLHFRFDGGYPWFEEETTDVIPRPFVDYFCDNIGDVNFQYAPPDNHMNDPEIKAAIAEGLCFNQEVFLRYPGYRGRGPQPMLDLEVPNGTVWDMYVTVHQDQQYRPVKLAAYEEAEWRTLDAAFEECQQGDLGCARWYKVSLDEPVEFICDEEEAASASLSS